METTDEEGMTECERGEVRRFDLVEGNTVDGVRTHVSRACEKGIRMKMPSARTTTASVLGSRGAVGTAGRGLDWEWEVRYPLYWMASGIFRHFSH
jgi:hypothetical protein